MIVYLGLTVLAGVGAAWLLSRVKPMAAAVLLLLGTSAAIVEGLPDLGTTSFPLAGMQDERQAYQWLRSEPRGPMLELPVGRTREGTRYLTGTLVHGNRIVNGYSGYGWALQDFFGGSVSTEVGHAGELLQAARVVGVRYVLVHRALYRDRAQGAQLAAALAAERVHLEEARDFGTTTVFVLRPADRPSPPLLLDPPLSLGGCAAEASHNAGDVTRAIDGTPGTRWLTGEPQDGSEWFALRCADTHVLTGVDFQVERRSLSDYPRRLAIDVSTDGASFGPIWEGGVVAELAGSIGRSERPTTIRIAVPPTAFRALRLRQTGQTPRRWFWSIDELQLRGR
jgi:hypothetical protein